MIYNDLIIQPRIWSKLTNYFVKGTLPNAFLFYGYDGIGKEAHAIEFSASLNCEKGNLSFYYQLE